MARPKVLASEPRALDPVVIGVLFPSVLVEVLVEVLIQLLVLLRHFGAVRDSSYPIKSLGECWPMPHARTLPFESTSISEAASLIVKGGLVVYPTDTVYGLGCDPTSEAGVLRLLSAKRRQDKPVSVLCSSESAASELVELSVVARRLAAKHWPGPLTIVAPLRRELPFGLHRGTGTLGVRVPALPPCLDLIRSCGGWLTGTSANISGLPSARTAAEAAEQLGGSVDMILDGGRLDGAESTVVSVDGNGVQVLRAGKVRVTDEGDR